MKSYLFKYLMHGDYDYESQQELAKEFGIPADVMDAMGRPFYELELSCAVDETGQVEIREIHSTQGGNSAIGGRVLRNDDGK